MKHFSAKAGAVSESTAAQGASQPDESGMLGTLALAMLNEAERSGVPRVSDAIRRWRAAIFTAARRGDLDDVQLLTKEYARWLALERQHYPSALGVR